MKTPELLQVMHGQSERLTERHPTPTLAKQARARAYALMHQVRTRHAIEQAARLYIDPEDPCVLVCDLEGPPPSTKYGPVLSLREGDECVIDVGDTLLQSVKARLKTMAAQVQADIGSRPCWVAQPVPGQLGLYKITRLPDEYNPATGEPRVRTSEQAGQYRQAEHLRDWRRLNRLQDDYEERVQDANAAGVPPPPVPQELRALAGKLAPRELAYLEQISLGREVELSTVRGTINTTDHEAFAERRRAELESNKPRAPR